MAEKKPDFVVSDRRKFTDEGELRTDVREDTPIPSSSSVQAGMGENDKPPEPPSLWKPPVTSARGLRC